MVLADLVIEVRDGALRFRVRAKPRARKSKIVGVREGALEVALAARPVDGAANEELVRTLADAFSVPPSTVSIVSGGGGRHKLVQIRGLTEAALRAHEASR